MKSFILSIYLTLFAVIIHAQNDIQVSDGLLFEGEPYLAINPNNDQHFVVAWMSIEFQQQIVIRTKTSWNGGLTWSNATYIPHLIPGHRSADPSMKFDHLGNLYLAFVDYNSETGETGAVYVAKSLDGGLSWNTPSEAISINDCPNKLCIDRPWMVIDLNPGPNQGNIYLTTMNAGSLYPVDPPYNPYLVSSVDGGATFSTPILIDGDEYLAGNIIPQPMPTPTVSATGVLHIAYPSFVPTQDWWPRMLLASTDDLGATFDYHVILSSNSPAPDNNLKTGSLLIANPNNANHLALFLVRKEYDDADIFMTESFDNGSFWSDMIRLNDDPINNGKLQDLVWADFDPLGNLAVCWRDRRDAEENGFAVASKIYGTYRSISDSIFTENFEVSSQTAEHAAILNGSGNDFMCIELVNDTLNAVWGDVRSGTLSIYLNRIALIDGSNSLIEVAIEQPPAVVTYPNPCQTELLVKNFTLPFDYEILDYQGKHIARGQGNPLIPIDISKLKNGNYHLRINHQESIHIVQFTVLNP